MKIQAQGWRGNKEVSLAQAIDDITIPDPYCYNGQLEKLEYGNNKLKEVLCRLLETIYGEEQYKRPNEKLEHILGHCFEVTL